MSIPKLKRVRVGSATELRTWLEKNSGADGRVMIVTCDKSSPTKYLSSESVRHILAEYDWIAEHSFTLNGNLLGHVVSTG